MKVEIQNFRCWDKKEVEFDPEGVTLIHGTSGAGKSSILEAIYFVIGGKTRNIITEGKKTCKVTLTLNNGDIIVRGRKPTVLKYICGETVLEGKVAQARIEEVFTCLFSSIGYISQGGTSEPFVLRTPSRKLEFLESLAFHGVDMIGLKSKVLRHSRKKESELTTMTARLEIVKEHLASHEVPDGVKFPVKSDNEEETVQRFRDKLQKITEISGKIRDTETKLINELQDRTIKEAEILKIKERVMFENDRVESLTLERDRLEFSHLELDNLRGVLNRCIKYRLACEEKLACDELREQLCSLKKQEDTDRATRLEILKKESWCDGVIEEAEDDIDNLRHDLDTRGSIEDISRRKTDLGYSSDKLVKLKKIKGKNERVRDRLQKDIDNAYINGAESKCPSCGVDIVCKDGSLLLSEGMNRVAEDDLVSKKKSLKKYVKQYDDILLLIDRAERSQAKDTEYQAKLDELEDISSTSGELRCMIKDKEGYIRENKSRDAEIRLLSVQAYSGTVVKLENNLLDRESMMYIPTPPPDSEHSVKESIDNLQCKKRDYDRLCREIRESQNKIASLGVIEEDENSRSSKRINREIVHCRRQSDKNVDAHGKLSNILITMERALANSNALKRQRELECEENGYSEAELLAKNEVGGSYRLKDAMKHAESVCLETFVKSLECQVQVYLDDFFADSPMMLRLERFKEKKSSKVTSPEIHIVLEYKNRKCDPSSLSGGELQRLNLAFSLAMAERFGLPMVLLDECTSNLDQELTSIVVESLKERFPEIPIVLVAHQVVLGSFDKVISV